MFSSLLLEAVQRFSAFASPAIQQRGYCHNLRLIQKGNLRLEGRKRAGRKSLLRANFPGLG
jgi:hypothetical protein